MLIKDKLGASLPLQEISLSGILRHDELFTARIAGKSNGYWQRRSLRVARSGQLLGQLELDLLVVDIARFGSAMVMPSRYPGMVRSILFMEHACMLTYCYHVADLTHDILACRTSTQKRTCKVIVAGW
jgi:hypothetical protein